MQLIVHHSLQWRANVYKINFDVFSFTYFSSDVNCIQNSFCEKEKQLKTIKEKQREEENEIFSVYLLSLQKKVVKSIVQLAHNYFITWP